MSASDPEDLTIGVRSTSETVACDWGWGLVEDVTVDIAVVGAAHISDSFHKMLMDSRDFAYTGLF